MKKISIFFILFIVFLTSVNANRDSVTNRSYGAEINSPYNMSVITENTACSFGQIEHNDTDVYSILNVVSNSSVSCSKLSNQIICNKNQSNGPIGSNTGNFKIIGTNSEILEKIGLDESIYSNISGNYIQDFNVKMNITIDGNGGIHPEWRTNFDFNDFRNPYTFKNNVIEYSDPSECGSCPQKNKIVEKELIESELICPEGFMDIGNNECSKLYTPGKCNDTVIYPIIPTNTGIINITDNLIAPTLVSFKLSELGDQCKKMVNGEYNCYANEELKFNYTLGDLGNPAGIKALDLFINNKNNDSNIAYEIINLPQKNITNYEKEFGVVDINFQKVGKYTIELQGKGDINNPGTFTNIKNIKLNIIANPNKGFGETAIYPIVYNTQFGSDVYANDSDYYKFTIGLKDKYGNNIPSDKVFRVTQDCSGTNCLYSDNNSIATTIFGIGETINTDGKIDWKLKSYVPGSYSANFNVEINKWGLDKVNTGDKLDWEIPVILSEFKKPVTGAIKVSNNRINWDDKPIVGTKQSYKVELTNLFTSVTPRIVNITTGIIANISGHSLKGFENQTIDSFDARIDADNNVLQAPIVIGNNLLISFEYNGNLVTYDLDDFEIYGEDTDTIGVKIIGSLQGNGKSSETGQIANISDVDKTIMRAKIRKNGYILTKNISTNQIINGVKLMEGDVKYSTIEGENIETLIIKNGNFFIDKDMSNIKGVIVLQDNYQFITPAITGKGNIFITPNVTKIKSILYADGGLISAKNSTEIFKEDSIERTTALQKQLILNGSIFTRNTIGGSIIGSNNIYTLPGGKETIDFNSSMLYDLNYVRRGNNGCDTDGDSTNVCTGSGEYKEPFIIVYDPFVQLDPPKGFENK